MAQGIAPPPTVLPIQIQGVSAYGSTGGATSIPPAIAVLPTGTLLRGMITGRNPQGQLVLHTEKGDIALKTDIFFKRGIELMIRMEKVHDETTARIITVDGKPFTKYMDSVRNLPPEEDAIFQTPLARQSPTPQTSAPIKQEAGVSLPSPPLTPQQGNAQVSARMSAILLTALPSTQMQTASVPPQIVQMMLNAPSGTQLAVKVTQLILPESGASLPLPISTPASSAPSAATTASALSPLPAAAPNAPPPVSISLPPLAVPPTATTIAPASTPPAPPVTIAMPLTPAAPVPTEVMLAPALPPMLVANQIPPAASTPPAPTAPLVIPTTAYATPSPQTIPTTVPQVPITTVPLVSTTGMEVSTAPPAPVVPPQQPIANIPSQAVITSTIAAPPAPVSVQTPPPVSPPTSGTVSTPTSHTLPTPTPSIPILATAPSVIASSSAPLTTQPPLPVAATVTPAPTSIASPPPAVLPSAPPSALTLSTQPATPTITATVLEGSATTGLTLHSSIGTLRLMSPHPLPVGTQIQFELEYVLPPTASTGTAGTGVGRDALEQLTALPLPVAAAIPEATGFQPRLIPKVGKELTTELVFLISALKGGDIRKWLGEDNLRTLEDTKADMLRRISAEFATMRSTLGDEAEPTRWTLYQLPFATGVGIEPLRLYHRESSEKDKDAKARGESGQHFIVDVTFTRIGILQLDGFVKKSAARHSFDLVVRSEKPLEDELKQGIREIFQEAGQITGYDGGVSFRHGQEALFHLPTPETGLTPDSSNQSIVV